MYSYGLTKRKLLLFTIPILIMSENRIYRTSSARSNKKDSEIDVVDHKNIIITKNVTNRNTSNILLKPSDDSASRTLLKANTQTSHRPSAGSRNLDFQSEIRDTVDGQLKILDIMLIFLLNMNCY